MFQLDSLTSKIVFYSTLVLMVLFAFFPIYWMAITSFKSSGEVIQSPPTFYPHTFTLEHYTTALTDKNLLTYLKNSLIVAGLTSLLSVIISSYAAYSFSKYRYSGRKSLMGLVLSAQLFPKAVLLITLYLMMQRLGLIDTYPALILSFTTFTLPLTTWMLKSYFDEIPKEVLESAYIDGASRFQVLHKIALPLTMPGLIATALFAFIRGWDDFIFALTLTSSDAMRTLPPGLTLSYLGQFESSWAGMMAASLITSIPVIVLFILLQRYLIKGLMAGAVD